MIGGRSALLAAAGGGLGYGNWTGNYSDVSLLLRNGTPALIPLDESPTPKELAIVGSARISTTVFKYGNGALVAGDSPGFSWGTSRLAIAPSLAFAYGTGDYTVEAWIYPTGLGNDTFNQGSIMFAQLTGGVNYFICAYRPGSTSSFVKFSHTWATSGEGVTAYSPDIPRNQWSHVAVVRSNGQVKVYGNGVSGSPVSNTQNFTNTTYPVLVGGTGTTTSQFEGYIDDLRITKGVARHTSNFSSSLPAELPANATDDPHYSDVSLLLRNGTPALIPLDESSAPKAITVFGNAFNTTTVVKHGTSAMAFHGSGDYLSTPYSPGSYDWWTSDFTVEAWVYANSWAGWSNSYTSSMLVHGSPTETIVYWGFGPTTQGALRFYWWNNGPYSVQTSNLIPTGSWNHIAMVRTSEGIRLFINGEDPVGPRTQPALGTSSTSYPLLVGVSVGTFVNGYIDDLRITKGVARYTSNFTPPAAELPANATDDPSYNSVSLLLRNGAPILLPLDESPTPKTITVSGNAGISQTTFKYGDSSLAFDGNGDYLSVPYNLSLALGSGNFTVESWIYKNVHKTGMLVCGTMTAEPPFDTKWQMFGDVTNGRKLMISTEAFILTSTSDLATGQWHHVAWARSSSTSRLFINGILEASNNDTRNYSATNDLWIGQAPENVSTRFWDGYIDDLRITKGVARYTKNFLPPPAELPAI